MSAHSNAKRASRRRTHRTTAAAAWLVAALPVAVACGHAAGPGARSSSSDPARPSSAGPALPPQYVVADPGSRQHVSAMLLGEGNALGIVVDRSRIVVGRGEPHLATELTGETIDGAAKVPSRLGGGYLFWTGNAVYRSAAFDGPLEPLVRLPDGVANVSFGPKFVLLRSNSGERWPLSLPKGERVAIDPLGVADVEGLDDGRALAIDDRGIAYASTDHGAHWVDVSAQLVAPPARAAVVHGEVWIYDNAGGAVRLELDGQLSKFDSQPDEKPLEMRAADPRWRGTEPPLRAVLEAGASLDDTTGIIIEHGDLVRVDLHTGELLSVLGGKLPPDATCTAVPTANDVLFACVQGASRGGQTSAVSFVVSHTVSGETPVVEQTFPGVVQSFFASDDGGLAIALGCDGTVPSTNNALACVRQPGGTWQQVDLALLGADAGGPVPSAARWVPRADGHAVAVITEPSLGIFDPHGGTFVAIEPAAHDPGTQGQRPSYSPTRRRSSYVAGGAVVDSSWSFVGSSPSLRGWQRHGTMLEIGEDGKVTRSPYSFELAASGPFGLGRSSDGRYYQSLDHGASWTEVAAPPTGSSPGDVRACSSAGCDLGGFYRMGWAARPPRIEPKAETARPAPEVRRTRPVEITCRTSGPVSAKALARTESSNDDLGLGLNRLPVSPERADVAFMRNTIPRAMVSPLHEQPSGDSESAALRAMLTGYATTSDNGSFEVLGPNKSPGALRRGLQFVPPFDPAAPVRKATLAMSEVLAAGRLAGLAADEILQDDMSESGNLVALTSHDPAAAADVVFNSSRGLVALVHPSERVKIAVRAPVNNDAVVISGVSLGGDEAALLELETTGTEHVFRMGSGGITDLFDINPQGIDSQLYPANPDALAVGPRGELAVIRTASGGDPSSASDPAMLLVPSQTPVALAPWSTLRLADDPSCREPGWRTTIHTIAPWVRITTPELRASPSFMMARVKWSKDHVCLEGLELGLPDIGVRASFASATMSIVKAGSWLVSRGGTFAHVAQGEGLEWRQPLECSVVEQK